MGGLVAKSCPTPVTLWTVAHQTPLSMEFSRQEYWNGLSFPSPGDLLHPGIEPVSPLSPTLAGSFWVMVFLFVKNSILISSISRAHFLKKKKNWNECHKSNPIITIYPPTALRYKRLLDYRWRPRCSSSLKHQPLCPTLISQCLWVQIQLLTPLFLWI